MMDRLSYPILAVMLDGKDHTEAEIISRIQHLIKPEQAVRSFCRTLTKRREQQRRTRNLTEKVCLAGRKEVPNPENVSVLDSIHFIVRRTLKDMKGRGKKRGAYVQADRGVWQLSPDAREIIKSSKIVTSAIGRVLIKNLRARGEFL